MRPRLSSSHFVGRAAELAELQLAVREARHGRPTLVLLGGDSGLGKTRLVYELERRLSTEDGDGDEPAALVLRGDSVQPADAELPYAPLLSALRPLVRERHPAFEALTSRSRAQLATILPGLEESAPREEPADPSGQLHLFEALLELIDVLGETSVVLLILEDVHWADRSTRAFVTFLARSLRQERLALVLTYRTDELHRRHPLRALLSELERLERARRIQLEPLDRDELAEVLTDILGAAPAPALLDRLHARGEGNPLYTEELLAAGLDGRGAAPESLRDAFTGRIERLSPAARAVVRIAAVGRTVDEAALEAVSGLEREALVEALREAVSEQVLVLRADGPFGFRHALLREVLYDDLLPGERSDLHLALARHLEGTLQGDEREALERAAAVAGHYAAAGEQPAALASAVRAALAAQRALAWGETADLAERALELWPRVPEDAREVELDHVGLLQLAARAHFLAADRSRADVLLRAAMEELRPEEDPLRYATLLYRHARTLWSLNRGEEAVAAGERALELVPEDDRGWVRPALLGWLARMKFLRGRFREAAADGEVALAAAVEARDRSSEGHVRNTLGMAQVVLGHVEEGVAQLRQAIELARADDDLDDVATAYANLADMLLLVGRTREGYEVAREGLAQTPRRLARTLDWMHLTVSELAFHAGDWSTAREHQLPAPQRLDTVLAISCHAREAELALGDGDEERAARALDALQPLIAEATQPQYIGQYGAFRGELSRRRRDLDGARAAVEEALGRLEVCTDDVMRIAQVSAVGARVEGDRAQRARDLRERGELRDALTRLRLHISRLEAAAQEGGPVERAYLLEGKAQLARAQGRERQVLWARAAQAWEEVQRPYCAAEARWREAECLLAAGERAGAAGAARASLEAARRLGARWLIEEVSALAVRGRLELEPASAGATAGNGDGVAAAGQDEDPFGLTPRERQVLALLAQGATNRQIGQALYMAEKTASVHVSRILAKLGAQGRTEAAAVAHRMHLA